MPTGRSIPAAVGRRASGVGAAVLVIMATLGVRPVSAQLVVRADNPLAMDRPDETLSLAWSTVRRALPAAGPRHLRVLDAASGTELLSQGLDADGDGAPDSLLFLASFRPHEVRRFRVEARPADSLAPRVFVMHDANRDDVAWESDRIAFRMYGEGLRKVEPLVSSGIDVWLKSVHRLVVRHWYAKEGSYHVDTGEGADFFTVGESLGAGGTAVWRDGRMYRAGNFRSYRILADGPVRVVFELHYDPWDAGRTRVGEVKRITMDAGQNLFRQACTFSAPSDTIHVVAGTVKREGLVGSTSRVHHWAWMSTWGPVDRANGGHGNLGTGVLLPNDQVVAIRETGDHYLLETTALPGEPVVFYTGAGWTASGDYRSVEDWWAYLDAFAERLAHPVRVSVEDGGAHR